MSFCKYSTEYIASSKTEVDNIFINDYLPFADPVAVKVYLFGLYKCSSPSSFDNTIESFSNQLNMSQDDILACFEYWQEQGLVQVLKTVPVQIRYIPLNNVLTANKLYKPEKYQVFNQQAQEIFEGKREISKTEYGEYYDFLERYHVEQEALLMIMKYCVDSKKSAVGYNYILTVAKNWANEGITTALQVEEKLTSFLQKEDEIQTIFKIIGIKRNAYVEERAMFDKWTNDYGFNMDTILYISKKIKKSGKFAFNKLDQILTKYFEMKLFSIMEIEQFEKNKTELYDLAKEINRNLGVYYESLDNEVETYILKWINLGFEKEVVAELALYCFKKSIRTLEGMDKTVNKFYKLGIVTLPALQQYTDSVLKDDQTIGNILKELSISRNVNYIDRENYKTWKNDWQLSDELIQHAVSISKNKDNAMKYLSRVLADWHIKGIKTVEEAKQSAPLQAQTQTQQNFNGRSYSKEQINALFDSIDDVEI